MARARTNKAIIRVVFDDGAAATWELLQKAPEATDRKAFAKWLRERAEQIEGIESGPTTKQPTTKEQHK